MVVVRIQNLRNCICHGVLAQCAGIIALVELLHVKTRSLCLPKTQCRNAFAAVTGNIHIIRNGNNGVVIYMREVVILILPVFLNLPFKMYFYGFFRLWIQPNASAREPVIRQFCLPAVFQLLLENAVFIADGVTGCRNLLGCHCIQVASSQTTQAAVSKTCVRFTFINFIQIDVEFLQNGSDIIYQFQVIQSGFQRAAHQKFHGKVIYALSADRMVLIDKVLTLYLQFVYHHSR